MDLHFQITSKLNKKIIVTKERWELITKIKHPIIEGKEKDIQESLANPDEIRQSKTDNSVYLYYKRKDGYNTCAVIKHNNGEGFIITAYITNRIKEGEIVFKK